MHDVRVALDLHQIGELHAVVLGDPADVIAAQVHEHDVLSPFLGIGQQLGRQGTVLGLVPAPPPGARQGPDGDCTLLDPNQDLRRAADQAKIVEGQVEQERAGIEHPEHPVDVERPGAGLELEPLTGHDLEDVAGLDVFLAVPDDLLVSIPGEIGGRRGTARSLGIQVAERQLGSGGGESPDEIVDPGTGRGVSLAGVDAGPEMRLRHNQDDLANMIEQHHAVEEREREVGQTPIVARHIGQVLGVADGIVGRVAHGSAGESGQPGKVNRAMEIDELLKLDERIGRSGNAVRPRVAGHGHDDLIAPGLEPQERLGPQETEPPDVLAADDALEQEGRRTPLDPAEGRDGCQSITG